MKERKEGRKEVRTVLAVRKCLWFLFQFHEPANVAPNMRIFDRMATKAKSLHENIITAWKSQNSKTAVRSLLFFNKHHPDLYKGFIS